MIDDPSTEPSGDSNYMLYNLMAKRATSYVCELRPALNVPINNYSEPWAHMKVVEASLELTAVPNSEGKPQKVGEVTQEGHRGMQYNY